MPYAFKVSSATTKIAEAICQLTFKNPAVGMIAMMKKSTYFFRLFQESIIKKVALPSRVPFLILSEVEV